MVGQSVVTGPAPDSLPFRWLGEHLALDFANTVAWKPGEGGALVPRPEYERLTRYGRLVSWGQAAGILSDAEAVELLAAAETDPEGARAALEEAIALRRAVHRVCEAIIAGLAAAPGAVDTVEAVARRALAGRRLVQAGHGFTWAWGGVEPPLDRPLWPVALSFEDLLVSDCARRIRQCAGVDCGFLFLNTGRGPGRRWCDMAHCGNRAKARRHYRRMRGER